MNNKRNGSILKVRFFTFLLPTVMSIMAMSLNEFVDSLIVSNLINSDAMSLITMASPLPLTASYTRCWASADPHCMRSVRAVMTSRRLIPYSR